MPEDPQVCAGMKTEPAVRAVTANIDRNLLPPSGYWQTQLNALPWSSSGVVGSRGFGDWGMRLCGRARESSFRKGEWIGVAIVECAAVVGFGSYSVEKAAGFSAKVSSSRPGAPAHYVVEILT